MLSTEQLGRFSHRMSKGSHVYKDPLKKKNRKKNFAKIYIYIIIAPVLSVLSADFPAARRHYRSPLLKNAQPCRSTKISGARISRQRSCSSPGDGRRRTETCTPHTIAFSAEADAYPKAARWMAISRGNFQPRDINPLGTTVMVRCVCGTTFL